MYNSDSSSRISKSEISDSQVKEERNYYHFDNFYYNPYITNQVLDQRRCQQYNIQNNNFITNKQNTIKEILKEYDEMHKNVIQYFKPNVIKLKINENSFYDLYYASSTTNPRFAIVIKQDETDLVYISQSHLQGTAHDLDFLAVIVGMRYCVELGIEKLKIQGCNQLVTKHNEFHFSKDHLQYYKKVINDYKNLFPEISFIQITTENNHQAKHLSQWKENILEIAGKESQEDKQYEQQLINQTQLSLEKIIIDFKNIFSLYQTYEKDPIVLDKNKTYSLQFYEEKKNQAFCFHIFEDVTEIYSANFFVYNQQFPNHADVALIYGLRFLLENQVKKTICFSEKNYVQPNIQNSTTKNCLDRIKQLFTEIQFKQRDILELHKLVQLQKTITAKGQQCFYYKENPNDTRKTKTLLSFKDLQ